MMVGRRPRVRAAAATVLRPLSTGPGGLLDLWDGKATTSDISRHDALAKARAPSLRGVQGCYKVRFGIDPK
jgi:hypothetical protein